MKYSGVMLGTEDPKALGEFYTKALGEPSFHEGEWYGWKTGGSQLMLGSHSEVKGQSSTPARIMLTLEVDDVKAEFKRLTDLGATVVAEPYQPDETSGMWLATVADPDGNYLQLSMPWE